MIMSNIYNKLSLVFAICVCCILTADGFSEEGLRIRRFLHGCPFAFPCALPPCENPVFGPHDCCGSCPGPETTTTTTTTTTASNKRSVALENSDLKVKAAVLLREIFKKSAGAGVNSLRQGWTTTTYPTTSFCPNPCTHHGYHYCHPLPCHIACVDAVKRPGACCYECLNGPNCAHGDQVIPEGQNVTLPSGDVAFCSQGDIYGGSVHVYKVLG